MTDLSSASAREASIALKLQLAIDLGTEIGILHAAGTIHRDLKPSSVHVDLAAKRVRLGGLDRALHLPRHRPPPAAAGMLIGSPAYMSPEQTGWMNRSVDSRSDLYAFGVMVYELLVGELPFTGKDLGEWIHCHVARRPVAPSLRTPAIPEPLSNAVLRLLAKSPDQRY